MSRRKPTGEVWKRGDWKPIPGFPGYEVSYAGRIRDVASEDDPVILKSSIGPCGFYTLQLGRLGRQNYQVGKLVALAWIGPRPDGADVRYLDGNLQNHNAANLAYGTRAEFYEDQAARARREEAAGAPTHCPEGHRYSDVWFGGWGERLCRGCRRADHKANYRSRMFKDKPCKKCGALMVHVHFTRQLCDDCGGVPMPGLIQDKPCKWCGETMFRVPYQREICHPCRRRDRTVQDKPCEDCGSIMARVHYTRKLCDGCGSRHLAEYRERYKAQARKGPRVSHCIDCGSEVISTGPGPVGKRCPEHKTQARQEASRRFEQKRTRVS